MKNRKGRHENVSHRCVLIVGEAVVCYQEEAQLCIKRQLAELFRMTSICSHKSMLRDVGDDFLTN
jgi:hypothetical protein